MALKYDGVAKVGDRIRSYDFDPLILQRPTCYVEGVVKRIYDGQFRAYVIDVDADRFGDTVDTRVGNEVFVPMGLAWGEYDGRVVRLPAAVEAK